jgi:putative addiction module component (TIGR02574 family)
MKLIEQIMLLPDDEKLVLVSQIIDSINDKESNYVVSDDVVALVQERIEQYKINPSSGLSLNEFKARFKEHITKR